MDAMVVMLGATVTLVVALTGVVWWFVASVQRDRRRMRLAAAYRRRYRVDSGPWHQTESSTPVLGHNNTQTAPELIEGGQGMPCEHCLVTAPIPGALQQLTERKQTRKVATGAQEHVGHRYTRWCLDVEPTLTAAQKAAAYEAFAVEFEALPPHLEPDGGWAENMAYLCRRIARRHRGEPVGEWESVWQRQSRKPAAQPHHGVLAGQSEVDGFASHEIGHTSQVLDRV